MRKREKCSRYEEAGKKVLKVSGRGKIKSGRCIRGKMLEV
jgi:hypothetical protein